MGKFKIDPKFKPKLGGGDVSLEEFS